jgi:hypothetical protein
MKKIIGIVVSLLIAIGLLLVAFLQIAPYLRSLLPNNEWTPILSVGIDALVFICGGIQIPLAVALVGAKISLEL